MSSSSGHRKDNSRKLPDSPVYEKMKAISPHSQPIEPTPPSQAKNVWQHQHQGKENVNDLSAGVVIAKKESQNRKKESPPSGSNRRESPTHHRKRGGSFTGSHGDVTKSGPSHTSPPAGTESEGRLKVSPKPGNESPSSWRVSSKQNNEISSLKESPTPGVNSGLNPNNLSQVSDSSSMFETFTVDKAHSFLESVSAITESALAKHRSQGESNEKISISPSSGSGSRGHRRTRSKDYGVPTAEKSKSVPILSGDLDTEGLPKDD